jgi:PAS domain S-box-containing protein
MPAAVLAAVMLSATFGAGVLGIAITDRTAATASWWPAAGTGLLTLLVLPWRWWRWLIPSLAVAYLLANWVQGRTLEASTFLALADIAETILVAVLVRRRMGRRMSTVTDFGWLLGISLAGAVVAALGVATTSARLLGGDFGHTILVTGSAHWASVMLIAPLGVVPRRPIRGRPAHLVVQLACLVAATLLAYSSDRLTLGFAPMPILIWAGVSFGYQAVAVEQVLVSIMVSTMTLLDHGPFAGPVQSGNQLAQLYLVSLAIAGLPLALAVGEQREATSAARRENRRTEAIIDSSTTPIMVTDSAGTILAINPATTRLTGFDEDQLMARPFWERLLPPEQWEAARDRFRDPDLFTGEGEGVILTAAGGERIVSYSAGILVDPDAETISYVITATDITAERASTQFLQHLLSSATTIAILGTDQNGALTLVNAGAERMLRITREQAAGRSFLEFLDPGELAERGADSRYPTDFEALVHDIDLAGAPQTRDWTWIPPDGMPLRVSMTSSLVADARDRPIGYLFVARDVTETRRNQELLHQALEREQAAVGHLRALDHAKDDFISTVSHELRTPLASIIGGIELLGDGSAGELGADQRHLLDVIDRNAERLLALANDLLLLATFESNSMQGSFAAVDLREVVTTSTATIAPLLIHRDLDVGADLPDEPVRVLGDAGYLERAVTNLLTNAIKFTPDGGHIRTGVGADPETGRAILSVTDSGIGIPADELADVFQRFFRSSNVRADAIQGTGLGLSIVRSIVESHQGRIDVSSRSGEGTTFTITLPLI